MLRFPSFDQKVSHKSVKHFKFVVECASFLIHSLRSQRLMLRLLGVWSEENWYSLSFTKQLIPS